MRRWHEPARALKDGCHRCGTVAPIADLQPAHLTYRGHLVLGGRRIPHLIVSHLVPAEWWRCVDEFECARRRRMNMGPLPPGGTVEIA